MRRAVQIEKIYGGVEVIPVHALLPKIFGIRQVPLAKFLSSKL
jgi:hypothetical protein